MSIQLMVIISSNGNNIINILTNCNVYVHAGADPCLPASPGLARCTHVFHE